MATPLPDRSARPRMSSYDEERASYRVEVPDTFKLRERLRGGPTGD